MTHNKNETDPSTVECNESHFSFTHSHHSQSQLCPKLIILWISHLLQANLSVLYHSSQDKMETVSIKEAGY